MKKQKGFSLIELLIVVAIILIIAAIAIPNLIRARIAANEASAVGSIRTINTAEVTYQTSYPSSGFSASLAVLGGTSCAAPTSAGACLLDNVLATGAKAGYNFTAVGANPQSGANTTYTTTAAPVSSSTGKRYFFSDESGVIRFNLSATATVTDSAL